MRLIKPIVVLPLFCILFINVLSAQVSPLACTPTGVTTITSLPAVFTGLSTCGAGDDVTMQNANFCGLESFLFSGEDLLFAYTPATSGIVGFQFKLLDDYGPYGKFILYENCPFSGMNGQCIGQVFYKNSKEFEKVSLVEAGKTYYMLVDASNGIPCFPFELTVTDCVQPRSVSGLAFDNDSVRINWYLPGNYVPAGGYEWKIVPDTGTVNSPALRTGIAFSQEAIATGLANGRTYKAFVRSHCTDTLSNWEVSAPFRTWSVCPGNLGPITVINDFPAELLHQTSCGLGDDLNYLNTPYCATGLGGNINGEDAVYQFTATTTGPIAMLYTATEVNTNALLYEGCPFSYQNGTCLGAIRSFYGEPELAASVTAGKTYYVVVDHLDGAACVEDFNLQLNSCVTPTLLDVVGEQTGLPKLYWTVPFNAYPTNGFEWRVTADTSGPDGPIVLSGVASTSPVALIPLPSARYFHVYMRSLCADGPGRWTVSDRFATKGNCPEDLEAVADITSFPAHFNNASTCGLRDKLNSDFSPLCPFASGNKNAEDAVYTINSPQNRLVNFSMITQQPGASLSIFLNCPFNSNTLCENYAERYSSDTISMGFLVSGGYTYYLVVDGPGPNLCFDYDLHLNTCIAPQSVGLTNIHRDSALLSWALPYDPTLAQQGYEWKIVAADSSEMAQPLLSGSVQTNQVQLSGLPSASKLKAYVRMHCGPDDFSPWTASAAFSTPFSCPANLGTVNLVNTLPFEVNNAATCGQGNDLNCQNISSCNASSYCDYLAGEDVVYQFTPTEDVCTTISLQTLQSGSIYYAIFKDCPFEQPNCEYAGFYADSFPFAFQAGHIYYLYLDQLNSIPCIHYDLRITPISICDQLGAALAPNGLTPHSASLQWSSLGGTGCYSTEKYEWRVVAAGAGPEGTLVATDSNSFAANAQINGLTPNTAYDFYVRSICHDNTGGPWSAPLTFMTWPVCPGSLGAVQTISSLPFQYSSTTCGEGDLGLAMLCSPGISLPGEDVIWKLQTSNLKAAQIYFESAVGGATVLLATVCPLANTDPNNNSVFWCKGFDPLEAGADSILVEFYPGIEYYIIIDNLLPGNCGNYILRIDTLPSNCGTVSDVQVSSIGSDKAQVSWQTPVAFPSNTQQYEIRVILPGGNFDQPLLTALVSPFINQKQVSGLLPGTTYQVYVRAICGSGGGDWAGPVSFTTQNCPIETQSNGVISLPAAPQVHYGETTCGRGNEFDQSSGICSAGAGEDVLYRIQVPTGQNERRYYFHFRTQEAGPVFSLFEDCNHGASCITGTRALDAGVYGFSALLSPGRNYYLLADHPDAGACFHFDFELDSPDSLYSTSDNPAQAYSLAVGDTCWQEVNTSSVYNPTTEPLPICMNDSSALTWVTFTAPPSGNITISTAPVDSFSVFDTQLALYDPFSWPGPTSTLLACDDNSGPECVGCSMLSYGGLVPGYQYYVGVAAARGQAGKFCLQLVEDLNVVQHEQVSAFQQPVTGNAWTNFGDGAGGVLAAILPNGNALGEVEIQTLNLPNIPEIAAGAYLVPRVFQINCSGPACGGQFAQPVGLRLVFADDDLQRFNDSTGLNFSVDDLQVFHYDGPQEDCNPLNNANLPVLIPSSQVQRFELGPKSFSVEFQTNSFSEFFIGSAGVISAVKNANNLNNWAIRISPVPVTDDLQVTFDQVDAGPVSIDILLPTGQLAYSQTIMGRAGENLVSLSMKNMPEGLYFILLKEAGRSAIRKVVRTNR